MKKIWKILFLSLVFLLISNISFASNARNLNEIKLASNTSDLNKIKLASNTKNSSNQSETNENQAEEILKSQKESLNIGAFIKETKKYTEDSLEGIDLNELFSNAIAGKIDNKTILGSISKIARQRGFRLH